MTVEQLTPRAETASPVSGPARARATFALLAMIIGVSAAATIGAMRHQSTTFDEILMPAAGARGFSTGDFDLVLDHPPLAQYLYGLPVWLSGPNLPDESQVRFSYPSRYPYARLFFWGVGNDPERIAFLARLVGVVVAAGLVLTVFVFARRAAGDVAAIFAAGATAFLPDVLAHGGISYNDVPMALAWFGAVWALDYGARRADLRGVLAAGLMCGIALGVKFSAIALAPVAVLLVATEAFTRAKGERLRYLGRVMALLPAGVLAVYLVTVAVYLGDFSLAQFRFGLEFNILHAAKGHGGVPAWLLGRADPEGFWYYFPVAFLLKTPAALHLLFAAALLGLARSNFGRETLKSPLRAHVLGALVFGAFLMRSNLNIGFRHAMPMLPVVAVLIGVGVAALWRNANRPAWRAALAGLLLWHAGSALSGYPNFIAWTSEYIGAADSGHLALADSSLDWGQSLLQLRDFMRDEGIDSIYLSYFGSAVPEGYGINYVPLVSFFDLPEHPAPDPPPRFIAISATNLSGGYVGDAFARFRDIEPYRVLGHSMFIYELGD